MIAAGVISSFLNVPLIDINSYLFGLKPYGGLRLNNFSKYHEKTNKILVIDDTVFNGESMTETKNKLSSISGVSFIYMCVYLEGRAENVIDFYLEDVREYTNNFTEIVLYEWNIFQHCDGVMEKCLCDIDGVFCLNPPDERNEKEYLNYIKNATPLFIPRTKVGGIISYRLIKNKEITEDWLHKNGIKYDELILFNASSWDERNSKRIPPEIYKGEYFKIHDNYNLFIESDDYQARKICEISKKPVYCVESNKMWQ